MTDKIFERRSEIVVAIEKLVEQGDKNLHHDSVFSSASYKEAIDKLLEQLIVRDKIISALFRYVNKRPRRAESV